MREVRFVQSAKDGRRGARTSLDTLHKTHQCKYTSKVGGMGKLKVDKKKVALVAKAQKLEVKARQKVAAKKV